MNNEPVAPVMKMVSCGADMLAMGTVVWYVHTGLAWVYKGLGRIFFVTLQLVIKGLQ